MVRFCSRFVKPRVKFVHVPHGDRGTLVTARMIGKLLTEGAKDFYVRQKAIEIFPDYFDALELLGTEYVRKEQFEAALPILTHAVEVNDKAYGSMYAAGFSLLKLKDFAAAVKWLERAAAGDTANPIVYLNLGLAYGNTGALSDSERALKKAYQLGGANLADAHLYLAGIFNKQGRFGEAWRELELYLKEAKGLKDKTQINTMIANLKAKEKEKRQP